MIEILLIGGLALLVAISIAAVIVPGERSRLPDAFPWPIARDLTDLDQRRMRLAPSRRPRTAELRNAARLVHGVAAVRRVASRRGPPTETP